MPIYEYACRACGREFEILVRGETDIACPACSSHDAERRLSVPARHGAAGGAPDFSRLGPPKGGGCGGGGCGCH